MAQRIDNPDQLVLKQKKGTWLRFIKLFPKCNLPWIWLALYTILEVGLIDLGINETDYTAQLFAGDTSPALVTKLVVVIIINLLGSNLLIFTRQITGYRITRNMRNVVLGKVLRLPMSYFKDENPRDAVYRIVNNSMMIESTIMVVLMPIFTASYTIIKVFGKVFDYDWRLSMVMLAFVPLQLLIAFIFGRLNFSISERNAHINSGLTQKLAEMVTNIPLAKAFAKEGKEAARGEALTERIYRLGIKSSWLDQLKTVSEAVVTLTRSLAIVGVGLLLLKDGDITKRAWISFFLFSGVFSNAVFELMMYWNNMKIIQGGADKVAEIMNAPEEDQGGELCEKLTGSLCLENVRFGYEEEKPVLKGVSCVFEDNEVTALLGVSGCGKTTLTHLLTRLYIPDEGCITVNGKPICDYALDDYRRQFVTVSQSSMIFSGTIRENICYGNGEKSEDALVEALKKARAYDFVMEMGGLDSRLEEYGNNLSGGQRQRLALARAMLSDAHYLILDEPVASMDAIATAELMEVLQEVTRGRCTIVIAHTAAILPFVHKVIVIEDGVACEKGEPEQVQKTNRFLRELMGKGESE